MRKFVLFLITACLYGFVTLFVYDALEMPPILLYVMTLVYTVIIALTRADGFGESMMHSLSPLIGAAIGCVTGSFWHQSQDEIRSFYDDHQMPIVAILVAVVSSLITSLITRRQQER